MLKICLNYIRGRKETMIAYFEDVFAKRGLRLSEIKAGEGLLSFPQFKRKVEAGPILDSAFGGKSTLSAHGPYPHLFQLDYIIDDMMKKGKIDDAQEFFSFFATDDGLKVWNDTFDLFKDSKDLKNTDIITAKYLDFFGIYK